MRRKTVDRVALSKSVQLYQVRFGLRPDKVDIHGRVVEFTFQLELSGTHDDRPGNAESPCRSCIRVLGALLEIADGLMAIVHGTSGQADREYQKRIRYNRACNPQCGVALALEIKTRRPFEQANDGWAMEFVQELTRFLHEHGCNQIEFPKEAEGQTAPAEELDPRSHPALSEGYLVPTPVA